ncbi:ABC transporter substrate-binding protein [Herbiconiux moechotypicola]|uniref:ABC transporter substrate-binding protein n=1 Tax=Herbiconiux moechotypicola TaxID=637393 RepID=A0ABP5QH96_9MICO|nr:ABC transporter substrate-binding protein [Herbiconiux moechotypicola]MCS5730162.1 ABC transporter substrate-binding protein [Herbiconiux moechotypicola]
MDVHSTHACTPRTPRGRRHARRATALLALGAATALAISGCAAGGGSGDSDDGGDKTLSVWLPGTNQAEIDLVTDTIVPAFEEETGAEVEVTYVDWGDISTKLNSAFAAGTAPDIFGHGPAATADFVANDRILDLDDRVAELSQADRDDLATALPGGQVDGVQYLMPLSLQGYLVMYDADAFTAAGLDPDSPPTTWEELKDAAETLTERNGSTITRSGFLAPSQAIARQQTFATFLFGEGGTLVNEAGTEAEFASAEGADALDFFTSLYTGDDAVSANLGEDYLNAPAAQQPLVQQTAAMTIQAPSMMQQIVDAAPDRDLRVMPPLSFEGGDPAAFGGAGPGLMINADSKDPDLAWSFIEYMLSPEVSTEYTQGTGTIPVRASAAESDYAKNSPIITAFLAASPDFQTNPNVVGWVQVRDALDKQLERALNGVATSQEALDEAAAEADKILGANG